MHGLMEEWANELGEKTGGKVKATVYPVGTLSPPLETYEALVNGMMDVGIAPDGYTPARFPLQMLCAESQHGVPSAEAGTRIRMALWEKFPEVREEFKDTKVLWLIVHGPANLHTSFPARTLEDLEGKELRTPPGGPVLMVEALGIVPVSMPMTDTFLAIEKGIVDGLTGPNEVLKSMRLADVTDYTMMLNYYTGAFFVAMNVNTWESLPPDVKQVIESLNEPYMAKNAKGMDDVDIEGDEFAKELGHEFIQPAPEVLEEIYNRMRAVDDARAADLEAEGKPARAIVDEAYRLVEEYSK
jgi:TRAP-type C4-dicarboxylate transport system substrate-binding protein